MVGVGAHWRDIWLDGRMVMSEEDGRKRLGGGTPAERLDGPAGGR